MAYCNVNQFRAKKLLRARNIDNIDHIEHEFKASAYYAWNTINIEQEVNPTRGSSTSSMYRGNKGINRRKSSRAHNKPNTFTNDNDQLVFQEMCDQTIIPDSGVNIEKIERVSSADPDVQEILLRD